MLRTRLEKLKTGNYKARGPKLLPNALTSYILDVTMTNSIDGNYLFVFGSDYSRRLFRNRCHDSLFF